MQSTIYHPRSTIHRCSATLLIAAAFFILHSPFFISAASAAEGGVLPVVKHGTDTELSAATSTAGRAWSAEQLATLASGGATNVPDFDSADPGATNIFPQWDDAGSEVDWLSAANFRLAVGVEIGSDVQAYSTVLDDVAGGVAPSLLRVDPGNELAAFAIDVTLPKNTKSVSADPTFTFSATPDAGTWTTLRITETGSAARTVTIPSAYSEGHQGNVTSFTLAADGIITLTFYYDGTGWQVWGVPVLISQLAEETVPAGTAELELETAGVSERLKISNIPSYAITKSTATNYTIGTTNANELYGGVIYVTGAATITIPAVAAGANFTVITVGAVAVSVDPNASDLIYLDGTALDDGDKATNTSTTGDIIVFTYYDATGWFATSNGWTDGGA